MVSWTGLDLGVGGVYENKFVWQPASNSFRTKGQGNLVPTKSHRIEKQARHMNRAPQLTKQKSPPEQTKMINLAVHELKYSFMVRPY